MLYTGFVPVGESPRFGLTEEGMAENSWRSAAACRGIRRLAFRFFAGGADHRCRPGTGLGIGLRPVGQSRGPDVPVVIAHFPGRMTEVGVDQLFVHPCLIHVGSEGVAEGVSRVTTP